MVNPTSGAFTPVLTGLAFPSSPLAMAITYVSGVRHFVVSLDTELVDVTDGTSAVRVLLSRTPTAAEHKNNPVFELVSGVAANDDLAFYVSGDPATPVLYRFRLSDPTPVAEAISDGSGGDGSIDPSVPLSQVSFGDVHGLAYVPGKGLYVADRKRDVIYLGRPGQTDNEVGASSAVQRAVGMGGSSFIPPLGYRSAGPKFPVNQPFMLPATEDGQLWISVPFGFAIYDTQKGDAQWVFFDSTVANSEVAYRLRRFNNSFTSVPVGPSSLFAIDADVSESNRTSLEPDRAHPNGRDRPTGSTLTDTTQDTLERFDAKAECCRSLNGPAAPSSRRRTCRRPTTSPRWSMRRRRNAVHLRCKRQAADITDPAGKVTILAVDASGDLGSITEPDGETFSFTYESIR